VRRDLAQGDLPREVADSALIFSRLERRHTPAGTVMVPR
jgi:hypothetical protein